MKEKTFVYGMSVEGANFTDREQETNGHGFQKWHQRYSHLPPSNGKDLIGKACSKRNANL